MKLDLRIGSRHNRVLVIHIGSKFQASTRIRFMMTPVKVIGAVFCLLLAPSLGGCDSGSSALRDVIDTLIGNGYSLSKEGDRELARFRKVYNEHLAGSAGGEQFRHFSDAFKRVRINYVREVADARLIDAAIKGVRDLKAKAQSAKPAELVESALDSMLTSLDPHSTYLNAGEYRDMQMSTKGVFGGLGLEVTMEDGLVKVVSPIENTPAFKAGFKPGDVITHLDGRPIKGHTLSWAVKRMRGRPGAAIRLTVKRSARAPFVVTIVRAIIQVPAMRWRVAGEIGYIRVTRFNEQAEKNLLNAMEEIRSQLGRRLKGLILDLRNNPGGLFEQSWVIADAFLEEGRIVSVKGRDAGGVRVYEAKPGDLAQGLPIVLLINGGSASASEIVAGALQDHNRAIVLGRRSFGKGSVQTITPLPVEGALRLTTQLFYTPSGRAIQAQGVVPDISLTVPETEAATKRRREADLPGALPGARRTVVAQQTRPRASLPESVCPADRERGGEDRPLGCAMAFLNAGSTQKFLALIKSRPQI